MNRRSLRSSNKRSTSDCTVGADQADSSTSNAKRVKPIPQKTGTDDGKDPLHVFTKLEANVSIDAAIRRLREACGNYHWEETDLTCDGVRVVASSPSRFTALFLEAGLEPYNPHFCGPEAICVPFRPALVSGNEPARDEKDLSFQTKYLIFVKSGGGAPTYVYAGEAKTKSKSMSASSASDCLHLQCRHELSAAGRDMLAWAIRGCKRNKYKSYLCQLEAGAHSQSDNLPITTPELGTTIPLNSNAGGPVVKEEGPVVKEEEVADVKVEVAVKNETADMTLHEMVELVNAEPKPPGSIGTTIRRSRDGRGVSISVGCLSEAACAILIVWFRQERAERVETLDWSMLGSEDARDYTNDVLAIAISSGQVREVTLSTTHACPPLISDHLLAAVGRGAATSTCGLVSVQLRSMAMSARGRTELSKGISKCGGLKTLVVSNCALGDQGVSEVARIVWGAESHLKWLEMVDLSGNNCGDAGCEALVKEMCDAAGRWRSLSIKSLVLSEERVSDGKMRDGAATSLAALVRNGAIPLKSLNVARVNMGANACAVLLSAIKEAGRLESLDISGNKFGTKGVPNVIVCCKPDGPLGSIVVSSSAVGSKMKDSTGSNGTCEVKIV